MKQLIFFLLFSLGVAPLGAATIYVTVDASPAQPGTSWSAATDLQHAAAVAQPGDQIWIANGTYFPGTERNSSFNFPDGVSVYGGFQGHEQQLNQRNPSLNPTILSGNIGDPASSKDNVYTIAFLQTGANGALLDGLTFEGGAAKGYSEDHSPSTCGAALYIRGGAANQSLSIINCIFTDNTARYGGAVYVDGGNRSATPMFQNCVFTANKADFKGGAVYNNGRNGVANSIFQNCRFENNASDYGACMVNNGIAGESSPLLISCQFINNYSISNGAVVFNYLEDQGGQTNPILENCELIGNGSILGDDVAQHQNTVLISQQPTQEANESISPVFTTSATQTPHN